MGYYYEIILLTLKWMQIYIFQLLRISSSWLIKCFKNMFIFQEILATLPGGVILVEKH